MKYINLIKKILIAASILWIFPCLYLAKNTVSSMPYIMWENCDMKDMDVLYFWFAWSLPSYLVILLVWASTNIEYKIIPALNLKKVRFSLAWIAITFLYSLIPPFSNAVICIAQTPIFEFLYQFVLLQLPLVLFWLTYWLISEWRKH